MDNCWMRSGSLLFACYRSFYRINPNDDRKFNSPYQRSEFEWNEKELKTLSEMLKKAEIYCMDWKDLNCVRNPSNKMFFVADPSYNDSTNYYSSNFIDTNDLISFVVKENSLFFNFDNINVSCKDKIVLSSGKTRFGAGKPKNRDYNQCLFVNQREESALLAE